MKRFAITLAMLTIPTVVFAQAAPAPATTPAPAATAAAPTDGAKEAGREKFRQACGADVEKLCAGVERAKGQIRTCLEANKDKVGATCKALMTERAAKAKS